MELRLEEKGQLGAPAVSERTAEWQCVGTDTDWKKVIGGKAYAFFIKEDGSLWAAGTSESGVQGTGDGMDHKELVRVGTDNDWADVTASHFWGYSAIGLKTDGTIWAGAKIPVRSWVSVTETHALLRYRLELIQTGNKCL